MSRRALISVSDKTGVDGFAKRLSKLGFEIISTGGTATALNAAGVPTLEVSEVTGFPECLDGRVKTLHPGIHGGLLAMRANEAHMSKTRELGIDLIDLVVVNLYPFRKTIEKPDATLRDAIENIDIGGPAMLRSAAKNYQDVTAIVDPRDYERVLAAFDEFGKIPIELNFLLAQKVFEHTAGYDALIAEYLRQQSGTHEFPETLTYTYELSQTMRYGENPHQSAAFYREPLPQGGSLPTFSQLHGKELSYNNIGDLDGALSLLAEFDDPAVIAVKHANPCGAATAGDILSAYKKAYESDPVSIFGGIIAANRVIDEATAAEINKLFIEIIAAPGYDDAALAILRKKKNIRILTVDTAKARSDYAKANENDAEDAAAKGCFARGARPFIKKVGGGLLVQTDNLIVVDRGNLSVVTKKQPTEAEIEDLVFAMTVVKHTKSNAIVIAKNMGTIGVGPGQNARILAAEIAVKLAGDRANGAVAASDAFFPFSDCVELIAASGVKAVIHPGGSKNDRESIDACDRLGISMVLTGIRHFKH